MAAGSDGGAAAGDARGRSLDLLAAFDEAWVTYLEQFAAWKLADAATLEVQLLSSKRSLARPGLSDAVVLWTLSGTGTSCMA